MKGIAQPRASEEFAFEQRNPLFRKALKKLIESGVPRSLARHAAKSKVFKPKINVHSQQSDEG